MLKKLFFICALAFTFTSVQAAEYKDGTYESSGQGNAGQIHVRVVVKDHKVASVKVLRHSETEDLLNGAIEELEPAIIKANGTNGVEAVSGASNSSNGIMEAVNSCLKKAAQ